MTRHRPDLEEQRLVLEPIPHAPIGQSFAAQILVGIMGWAGPTADSNLSSMIAGKRVMSVGLWRRLLFRVPMEARLLLARTLLSGSGLKVEIDTFDGAPLDEADFQDEVDELGHESLALMMDVREGRASSNRIAVLGRRFTVLSHQVPAPRQLRKTG